MGPLGSGARRRQHLAASLIVGCLVAFITQASAAAAGAPDLSVSKASSAPRTLAVGDVFTYTLTVANGGTATAHEVELEDDLPLGLSVRTILPSIPGGTCTVASSQTPSAPPHTSVHCELATLSAGSSATVSFDVKVTADAHCGALTNTVVVTANDEPAGATADDEASVTDTVGCPSISLLKVAPRFAYVGEAITFTMKVRNTGSITLHGLRVRDRGCLGSPSLGNTPDGDSTLSPGETWIYRCGRTITADTPDPFTTTATVTGRSSAGRVHAGDRATVRILRPGLAVRVTADPVSAMPGDTITYRYAVRNTGDATITDIAVDDDHLGHVGEIARLGPGRTVTLSVDRLVSARHVWVIDLATAAGSDPNGRATSASGRAAVTIIASRGGATGGDGTAFTGAATTGPAAIAIVLAVIGTAALVPIRRRRS